VKKAKNLKRKKVDFGQALIACAGSLLGKDKTS
jgi:hypothetical protein